MFKRVVVVAVVAGAALVGGGQAQANNDPHRQFVQNDPFDLPIGVCGFPVHVDVVKSNQYSTTTTVGDATVIKFTGSLVWKLTNTDNGKSVTENISGPGTVTIPSSGTVVDVDLRGNNIVYIQNGADYGLPNLMLTSGRLTFSTDFATDTITSLARKPHVRADLCAALA